MAASKLAYSQLIKVYRKPKNTVRPLCDFSTSMRRRLSPSHYPNRRKKSWSSEVQMTSGCTIQRTN